MFVAQTVARSSGRLMKLRNGDAGDSRQTRRGEANYSFFADGTGRPEAVREVMCRRRFGIRLNAAYKSPSYRLCCRVSASRRADFTFLLSTAVRLPTIFNVLLRPK